MKKVTSLSYVKNLVNNARITSRRTMKIKFNWRSYATNPRAAPRVYSHTKKYSYSTNCIIKYVTFTQILEYLAKCFENVRVLFYTVRNDCKNKWHRSTKFQKRSEFQISLNVIYIFFIHRYWYHSSFLFFRIQLII